jgi:thiamine-monophosphate kinase
MAVEAGLRCAIDVSDGLLADIGHICERSKVGAVVHADAVPVSDALREAFPEDALKLACTGGEDYELVLVGPRETLEAVREVAHLSIIGEIVKHAEPRARLLGADGREISFRERGWDAFRS